MRAPITDKHLLEMMWERFPEIMKRGAEQPPQRTEERNFCPRCGKRAGDYIHTCTPPQD